MLENYKILFADDEKDMRDNMFEILSFMSNDVLLAEDGEEALQSFYDNSPDIVILDIEMPKLNGLEVAKKIRETNQTIPIIISTAYTETKYFLQAVELNLTSYILKPITIVDLKESLKKALNNINFHQKSTVEFSKNIYYENKKRILFCDNKEISLTKIQMLFLEYMIKNPNRIISYEKFENNIWDTGMSSGAIRSLVRDIRKHLPKDTISNIAKVGYKMVL